MAEIEVTERMIEAGVRVLWAAPADEPDGKLCRALYRAMAAAAPAGWRTLDTWHDDDGPVLWTRDPSLGRMDEADPYYIGSPMYADWPLMAPSAGVEAAGEHYYTHWMPLPKGPGQ